MDLILFLLIFSAVVAFFCVFPLVGAILFGIAAVILLVAMLKYIFCPGKR